MKKRYEKRRGLSERIIRRLLERQGWTVWLGGSIGAHKNPDAYPNVQKKYARLHTLLGTKADDLEYLTRIHHGMPDFLCYRRGEWKFIECKLGHEQLLKSQKLCFPKLLNLGFVIEIHKLVDPCTKTRVAIITIETGEKKILEKQLRLKLRW